MNHPESEPQPSCLLTGLPGRVRRTRTGTELAATYKDHFNLEIPENLARTYFQTAFSECACRESGLQWYEPATAGGSDFYEFLSESLDWYYKSDTWDKTHALGTLKRLRVKSIFEAGCGAGNMLTMARAAGCTVEGSEMNVAQYAAAQAAGFRVYRADSMPVSCPADALVMLQVLEHIQRPLEFVRDLLERVQPQYLLIAVPCHETLLGITSDPLVWPPHHISSWSHRAFETLAKKIGATVNEVCYEPLDWFRFEAVSAREKRGRLRGLPSAKNPGLLKFAFRIGRLLGRPWATRAHTIFGVFEFKR